VNAKFPAATTLQPTSNFLLAALPEMDYRKLQPKLEPVPLLLGEAISDPGERMTHVFFPTEGIVSLVNVLEDGSSGEIAVTGNEGLVGISLFLGGATAPPRRAVVQSPGHAYRLQADFLMKEFERAGELQHLLLRYTQALITQVAQTAACNRHHSLAEQLCRCLLMRLDRLPGNELHMTQELIANALGVRREGVTEVASYLQKAGLIQYSRGRITVLDRPGLEQRGCECYAVIKNEYARLLANQAPASARPKVHQAITG
jgi:CRP-like cAMP-binding protein